MVKSTFEKAGKSMPSGTITSDMDFAVPFEGIPELNITLAMAILLASEQFSPDMVEKAILKRSDRETIRFASSLAVP